MNPENAFLHEVLVISEITLVKRSIYLEKLLVSSMP